MSTASFNGLPIISVIAVVAPVLAASVKVLKLPSAVMEIVAGIIVGPPVLARVKVDQPVAVVPLLGLAGRDRADPGDRVFDVLDRRGVGAGQAELMLGLTRREEPARDRLIAGTQTLAENAITVYAPGVLVVMRPPVSRSLPASADDHPPDNRHAHVIGSSARRNKRCRRSSRQHVLAGRCRLSA
jgi:hypothetical protein